MKKLIAIVVAIALSTLALTPVMTNSPGGSILSVNVKALPYVGGR